MISRDAAMLSTRVQRGHLGIKPNNNGGFHVIRRRAIRRKLFCNYGFLVMLIGLGQSHPSSLLIPMRSGASSLAPRPLQVQAVDPTL